jgi:hypothetical protein
MAKLPIQTWGATSRDSQGDGQPNPLAKMDAHAAAVGAIDDPMTEQLGVIRRLSEIPNHGDDNPDALLGRNYLNRSGGLLFTAPTGNGKSTAIIQMCLSWAAGLPAFGIHPRKKMVCLIVQAENDDQDIAEMRDGILNGMVEAGYLTEERAIEAVNSVHVVRDVVNVGDGVGPALDAYIEQVNPDIVVLDPIFSYIGGDTNNAKDVSHFLRNVVNPVIVGRRVGFIAVHHSNKPPQGAEKSAWRAGDFAYLGAGSAEFANWARAVLSIRSIGSHDVFQLVAGKRGKRIGWRDEEDNPVMHRYIKHATHGICWLDASDTDVRSATKKDGSSSAAHISSRIDEAKKIAMRQVWRVGNLKAEMASELEIKSDRKLQDLIGLLGDQEGIGRGSYYEGRSPVYLIGPKVQVLKAVEAARS